MYPIIYNIRLLMQESAARQAITFTFTGFGGFWRQHAWGNAVQFYRLEAGEGQSVWCGPAYLFITPVNTGIGMGEAASGPPAQQGMRAFICAFEFVRMFIMLNAGGGDVELTHTASSST